MKQLLAFPIIVLLFVMVRAGDLAISNAIAHSVIRAIAYGIVAILALLALILTLVLT